MIDALGGITVDVPEPILSNKFDCPFDADALRELAGLALRARARSTWTAGAR